MSVVVSNASPLISLARVGQFTLLKQVFQNIVIPDAVWKEVVINGKGRPAANLVIEAKQHQKR